MPKKISNAFSKFRNFGTTKKILIVLAVLIAVGIAYHLTHRNTNTYQFITVTKGSITESVSVTGTTTPVQSVSLGFQDSGDISNVYYAVGDTVSAGSVLAALDTSDLSAQLKQAQAGVDAQTATLEGLKVGSQPEDIASSQASVDKANQDLANMYASISDASIDGYAKAGDAVRTQLDPLFLNAESNNVQLSFSTSNPQLTNNVDTERMASTAALNAWQSDLSTTSANSSASDLDTLLSNSLTRLETIRGLLADVSTVLNSAIGLDQSTLAAYKAGTVAGQNEVNTATKNLNTIMQNIASQKLLVAQLQAALDLKKAGSTQQDIDAQQAQVEQAQANVESIEAKLQNSKIIAPLSGVLTQFDAKVGQTATPGAPLISIIGSGGFEVDAGISETDIGKLAVGDTVAMTLDAFPNETFSGSVFYIAPAETDNQGVITYLAKISFDKTDPRLKSGLTANLVIQTNHKDTVLILPQYAILLNDKGTFVETVTNKNVQQIPVTLGIQDEQGNVEIQSGVTEGEQVLNIGLKTQ